jgi:hypothetical protein
MNETSIRQIRIDKDGVWYYGEHEIFRKEIIFFFYANLKCDQTGSYLIELNVEVEDTPFIVKSINRKMLETDDREMIYLSLSDGTVEQLDPHTLCIGKDNVPYCNIRKGLFKARFSRAAYYQMADFIEHDKNIDAYFISLNGQSFYIKKSVENCSA